MDQDILLNRVHVPRVAFLEAARSCVGLPWAEVTSSEGTNCRGLVLLALKKVGLLYDAFDENLSELPEEAKNQFLWRMLHANATLQSPLWLLNGDLLLSCWSDVDRRRKDVHHLSIYSADGGSMGGQISCVSRESGGTGKVAEVPMSVLDHKRIKYVFRLCALEDSWEG